MRENNPFNGYAGFDG